MKIAIASDHGGFRLKKQIAAYLQKNGYSYQDFGALSDEAVDYPDFALPAAQAVADGEYALGILCCGTGVGVSIVANKVPGIRAANCSDPFSARMSREHNDANVLTLGERVLGCGLALEVLAAFLQGRYLGGRHACRVEKIKEIEAKFLGQGEADR
ncbi:MAG: ribose 5-phosphate isomerase B [Dethiobacter sp.]|jgi:ribose 5-phosphate isomerase B|nr:ribose 5-phosphate isomerase B [Dethiobacter sp.]MBS3898450.1 ribose 5-phosphate isomerase B [Dethiobacter sp.]MBS3982704.1 ribose 5-phosphate isomerase B [Dethiobacter sp.]MCL4463540.1 ribose 5-phosphate isomerase B [Bacillota bacterium]